MEPARKGCEMKGDGKWGFESKKFNGDGKSYQMGSIYTPSGLWFAAVENACTFDNTDQELLDRVLKVLNRELPNGHPRVRRKKVK